MPESFSKRHFMQKYNVTDAAFRKAGVSWEELSSIKDMFEGMQPVFSAFARDISDKLERCGAMHSMKVRVKDPEHLIEKVIRKNIETANGRNGGERIYGKNFTTALNDIVGVRVLHLFKDDWVPIHSFILDNFRIAGEPCAYIREGDLKNIVETYEKHGCRVTMHPFGYRSVHYVIESAAGGLKAEIQVRTLFEEAWSEIDHKIRYPYYMDDGILKIYSLMLNRLAGSADEISTYIKLIRAEVENMRYDSVEKSIDLLEIIEQKNREIEELQKRLGDIEKK